VELVEVKAPVSSYPLEVKALVGARRTGSESSSEWKDKGLEVKAPVGEIKRTGSERSSGWKEGLEAEDSVGSGECEAMGHLRREVGLVVELTCWSSETAYCGGADSVGREDVFCLFELATRITSSSEPSSSAS
jgi:hypothetical protein